MSTQKGTFSSPLPLYHLHSAVPCFPLSPNTEIAPPLIILPCSLRKSRFFLRLSNVGVHAETGFPFAVRKWSRPVGRSPVDTSLIKCSCDGILFRPLFEAYNDDISLLLCLMHVESMADSSRTGPVERDVEQAITALKKGACLLKYGRRGKPKFCPFRISNDGLFLVWFSGREEKRLRLSSVSKIVPGQRTAIFHRYPRPEKEYQSFSLIFDNDSNSLDLICKDREEAEVWFTGLRSLISGGQIRKSKSDSSDANSPVGHARKSSPLMSSFGSTESLSQVGDGAYCNRSSFGSPSGNGSRKSALEDDLRPIKSKDFLEEDSRPIQLKNYFEPNFVGRSMHSIGSESGSISVHSQFRVPSLEAFRVSMSSALSTSSHGSGQDDADALGDVYMWGEGAGDGILGGGVYRVGQMPSEKLDAMVPKALESALVLDVQHVTVGSRHAALVTKQGEVFCWGEEAGGRLGHGVDADVPHPNLIETLSNINVDFIDCGEYHSCAITCSGEIYTWGNGTFGLLGHGSDVSHWMPKRVSGPLEGLHISSVSCGTWHTALVTSSGQLFTFGDGTFGVLGHGDRCSAFSPKEVDALKGLKTIRVACGVWHTAAIVEVMVGASGSSICSSGKLFTWGDGDKGRLGHGDREQRLVPTCVGALVDHSLCRVVCGHSLTVALTDSGHVYTVGSTVYGQLGDPKADGKFPGRVEGELCDAFVEEIAAGAFHVAVLTSKSDVYTWGKGSNGRLGHGDVLDRKTPTLVEALKDKQVKGIACGTNFTMAICLHKWVSGADHSACSGCRQPFGFTRKRHNCYNCGLVFCHSCTPKKALKACLAPNPKKPYRICDSCAVKLKKAAESSPTASMLGNKRVSTSNWQDNNRESQDKYSHHYQPSLAKSSTYENLKPNELKSHSKRNKRSEISSNRGSPVRGGTLSYPAFEVSRRLVSASVPHSRIVSRASSPAPSRRSSPPRSLTPISSLMGKNTSKLVEEDLKKTNEGLVKEIMKLKAQVDSLSRRCQLQDAELKHSARQLHGAIAIAGEETAKCKAAKDVIKSLTAQIKVMTEHLTGDFNQFDRLAAVPLFAAASNAKMHSTDGVVMPFANGKSHLKGPNTASNGASHSVSDGPIVDHVRAQVPCRPSEERLDAHLHSEDGPRTTNMKPTQNGHQVGMEWVEQDEQGVFITFVSLPDGARDLKRVRFSRKRFSEKQAELWWQENKARVHEQYNVRLAER
ncbi:hypothetical protein GOP47_0026564 [Adiantum capillus-veneris]|nr:hypothetical protein GOP47_0026564 [Adiantum capillus-veneris]